MKLRTFFSFSLFALTACNADNAVVGGHCRAGFTESDGACTKTKDPSAGADDDENRFGDGTPSASSDDASTGPGSTADGGGPGGRDGRDGGLTTSAISVIGQVPPGDDAGAPTNPNPLECDAPLVACRGACIPVASDGDNCGACGKICPSNICIDGECQGALAGDVIVLGHEFASSASSSAQAKMIANAVSIPTTDPIRVLSFDGDHPGAPAERSVIAASVRYRGVSFEQGDDVALEASDLARHYDIVLIHGAGSSPAERGGRWASSLDTFTKKGGIVVALDDGTSDIPALLTASGLLSIEGHIQLADKTPVAITAPNDAVGIQVLSPYAPLGVTVGFLGVQSSPDVTIVGRTNDQDAYPMAIHRFVR